MLMELREVEVHIEPEEVLTQALREGDIDVSRVVSECIYEESVSVVLDAIDKDEITEYCERYGLSSDVTLEMIFTSLPSLNQEQKALLLWQLLRSEVHHA